MFAQVHLSIYQALIHRYYSDQLSVLNTIFLFMCTLNNPNLTEINCYSQLNNPEVWLMLNDTEGT